MSIFSKKTEIQKKEVKANLLKTFDHKEINVIRIIIRTHAIQ